MKTRLLAFVFLLASPLWAIHISSHTRVRVHTSRRHLRLRHRRHRRPDYRMPLFVPTHESLLEQNEAIDRLGLERIDDSRELAALIDRGELVPIVQNQYVQVAHSLPEDRAYVRPWVNDFLQELGYSFYAEYHEPIQVNSAVRTMHVQWLLRRWNRNAAPIHGESASSHMAGATIDLQRRGLTRGQIRFMEVKLMYLYARKQVLVEEELRQPCFHIMVLSDKPIPVQAVSIDDTLEVK